MKPKKLEKKKALELRRKGVSVNSIAEILNVSKGSVSLWLKDIPQPLKFTKEFRHQKKVERLQEKQRDIVQRKKEREEWLKVHRKSPKNPAEMPFDDYWLYGPVLHKKENRFYAHLRHKITGEWRLTLFSRYKMSVHLGCFIKKGDEVDHIDGDKLNDALLNLQILSQKENIRKSHKKSVFVDLICPECGQPFRREKRKTHLSMKSKKRTFCNRHCRAKFVRRLQLSPV